MSESKDEIIISYVVSGIEQEEDQNLNKDSYASRKVTIKNKNGLHARPAAKFVQTAYGFKSEVRVIAKGKNVDAKSILMMMAMGLKNGDEIKISADGPDANEAVKKLVELINSKFGEE